VSNEAWVNEQFEDFRRQLRELGPSIAESFAPVVAQLQQTIIATIQDTYYTKVQTDARIASPGAIAPTTVSASGAMSSGSGISATGDVTASGRVVSAGIINSPGTKGNIVTVGYSAVYIDSAGNMGGNTSTRRSKTNIEALDVDLDALLALSGYRFQRVTDVLEMGEAAPWQSGFMAEEVELVAPLNVWHNDDGLVEGVRYEELVVPLLLAVARERAERLNAEAELATFKAGILERLAKLEV
jgi:hypothetical protein